MSQPPLSAPSTRPDPDVLQHLGTAAAVGAALRTGLLAEIARGRATVSELAQRTNLDARATALVVDALQGARLVRRDGDEISPGDALLAAGQAPGGYAMSLSLWAHTEEFLRTGVPFMVMDQAAPEREQAYRTVVSGLAAIFEGAARELAGRLPVQPKTVLDIGCGSGVWSLALAERNQNVQVTGLDLPAVLENFRARAAALSLTDRAHTLPADVHEAELPAGAFDLVVVANVLRLDTPERAANIIQKVSRCVAPEGSLLVIDALATGTPERDHGRSIYALHLGLRTRTGSVHSPETISQWLAQAGFPRIQAIDVAGGAGGIGSLLATRN